MIAVILTADHLLIKTTFSPHNNLFFPAEAFLGYPTNCQKQENLELIRCIENLCEIWTRRTISPIKRFDFLFKLTNDYKMQTEALSIISSVYEVILENSKLRLNTSQRRMEDQHRSVDGHDNTNSVLLDWLIQQSTNGCYDINVKDEVNTLIFAVRENKLLNSVNKLE